MPNADDPVHAEERASMPLPLVARLERAITNHPLTAVVLACGLGYVLTRLVRR